MRSGTSAVAHEARSSWRRTLLAALVLALVATAPARGQEAPFGSPGQRVVSGAVHAELDFGSGFSSLDRTTPDQSARDLAIGVAPALLYFVVRNLGLGVSPSFGYADVEMTAIPYRDLDLALAVGAGWNVPLTDGIGLLPQVWVGGGYVSRSYDDLTPIPAYDDPSFSTVFADRTDSGAFVTLALPLPLRIQLGAATYAMVGPHVRLREPLGDEIGRALRVGLTAGLGGFF